MTDGMPQEDRDWIVPAVLVGVTAVLILIVALVLIAQASDTEDDSIAGQLETWSSCLRSEGANVPLVETLRGGGFRITVDGSLVEDGVDEATLRPALVECEEEAPDGVRQLMTFVEGFSDFPFSDFEDFEDFEWFEEFGGFSQFDARSSSDGPRFKRDIERLDLSDICDLIDSGDIDTSAVPRRILRACV